MVTSTRNGTDNKVVVVVTARICPMTRGVGTKTNNPNSNSSSSNSSSSTTNNRDQYHHMSCTRTPMHNTTSNKYQQSHIQHMANSTTSIQHKPQHTTNNCTT